MRHMMESYGLDRRAIDAILRQAESDMEIVLGRLHEEAMQKVAQLAIERRCPEIINNIHPAPGSFELRSDGADFTFYQPPKEMLNFLLKNAKPMKDGSGVYKVIPIGKESSPSNISSDIFSAQKAYAAKQLEALQSRKTGGKIDFKTATSKQNASTQWVIPARKVDVNEEIAQINEQLRLEAEEEIQRIVDFYLEPLM